MSQHFLELYQEALTGLQTGGMALEASLQEIEEGKRQAIAGGQQALVSGGLSGTTMAAGVPIQAEKIAGRQRLGARGRAEQTYLTTLASFAAFSQRGVEAQKEREFRAQQAGLERKFAGRQAELGRIAATGTTQYGEGDTWGQYDPDYMQSLFGDLSRVGATGGDEYAQQFPSLYDQGGIGMAPDLGGGGAADTPWPTAAPLFKEQEELGIGGGYAPQTGDYMSVEGGPGGPILGQESFKSTMNYTAMWYRKTGEKLSQQAAYEKLNQPVSSKSAGIGSTPAQTGGF